MRRITNKSFIEWLVIIMVVYIAYDMITKSPDLYDILNALPFCEPLMNILSTTISVGDKLKHGPSTVNLINEVYKVFFVAFSSRFLENAGLIIFAFLPDAVRRNDRKMARWLVGFLLRAVGIFVSSSLFGTMINKGLNTFQLIVTILLFLGMSLGSQLIVNLFEEKTSRIGGLLLTILKEIIETLVIIMIILAVYIFIVSYSGKSTIGMILAMAIIIVCVGEMILSLLFWE